MTQGIIRRIVDEVSQAWTVAIFGATVSSPGFLLAGVIMGSFSFPTLGLIFGFIPTRNPGDVQMPSTLLRWGLLFISSVFVPLPGMGAVARALAYLSPLTYAQDLMNHAVLNRGLLNPWLDVIVLLLGCAVFLVLSLLMHRRSRQLGADACALCTGCDIYHRHWPDSHV